MRICWANLLESDLFCTDLMNVLTKKDGNFAICFHKMMSVVAYAITTVTEPPTTYSCISVPLIVKPLILQENLSNSFRLSCMFLFV